MPKLDDINAAFRDAVRLDAKGHKMLRTEDFIRELREVNWHFNEKDANDWIARYQPFFVDKTPDFSENRLWMLRNMGRIF